MNVFLIGARISAQVARYLVLCLAVSILSACGGGQSAPEASRQAQQKPGVDQIGGYNIGNEAHPSAADASREQRLAQLLAQWRSKLSSQSPSANKSIQAGSDIFSAHGWWWDQTSPGTGFAFEAQGDSGFVAFFMYEQESGKAVWYAGSGYFDGGTFTADLFNRSNGQAANNPAFKASEEGQRVGAVQIEFNGNNAVVRLPLRTFNATRFIFNGNTPAVGNQPEAGWWWNPSQPGRGYAIEVQGGSIFFTMFHYNSDGTTTWHLAGGALDASNALTTTMDSYIGGQALNGTYRQNIKSAPLGPITMRFTGACSGSLVLPGNINVPIEKFTFGPNQCRKTAPPVANSANLSGTLTAQIPAQNFATGSINYGSISTRKIRGVRVEVINASTSAVLAATTTDGQGRYYASVPANTQVLVRVYSQMIRTGSNPSWAYSVRDNTNSDALYVLDTPSFNTGSGPVTRDILAELSWGGSTYTGVRASAPFAILDTVYAVNQKILSVAPQANFPPLTLYWSVNNTPATRGDLTRGEIGGAFFTATRDAQGNITNRRLYLAGKDGVGTDEFDATVVAHEFGHYIQSAFARNDSVGGSHTGSDFIDMRVGFSEGWATALAGMGLNVDTYASSSGPAQGNGFIISMSLPISSRPGWFRERTVTNLFYDLHKQKGFAPVWTTWTTNFANTNSYTTMHSYASNLSQVAPYARDAFNQLLRSQNINSSDEYGIGETNSGPFLTNLTGFHYPLPLYKPVPIGQDTQSCVSSTYGTPNKLGNYAYHYVDIAVEATYVFTITGGIDPDFTLFQKGTTVRSAVSGVVGSETAAVVLKPGRYIWSFLEFDYTGQPSTVCFNLNVRQQ